MTDKVPDTSAGLYIHIPFCEKKCAYCDFYSSFLNEDLLDIYIKRLIEAVKEWGGRFNRPINTVYLGGGTPSLLGKRIIPLMETVGSSFSLDKDAEITMEANPSHNISEILEYAKAAGVNRLSIGAQSGNSDELKLLGRTHSASDTADAVKAARSLGFDNISLDVMLGLPDSSSESLEKSLNFICGLLPEHISAYILKIEENTLFYHNRNTLSLPDDDAQAEQYLLMCSFLEKRGYSHYEISNFSKAGKQSRHNLKYWNGCEYLGIGPSAHSFIGGKRFYYPRDIKAFICGCVPISDGSGGGSDEYIMLKLRLSGGVDIKEFEERFGRKIPTALLEKCKIYAKNGLIDYHSDRFSLTDSGMLVSNSIITELLECFE